MILDTNQVLSLKANLEADYRKKSEAIDTVLEMLQEEEAAAGTPTAIPSVAPSNAATPDTGEPTKPVRVHAPRAAERKPRVRGIQEAVRGLLPSLPEIFTGPAVRDAVRALPKFAGVDIRSDSVRVAIMTLVGEGLVEVVEAGTAGGATTYRRLSSQMGGRV
jgi:hypothetical protein